MKHVGLILPDQLFAKHPLARKSDTWIFWEAPHFFRRYNFHKKKLLLHRATMQAYAEAQSKRQKQILHTQDLAAALKKIKTKALIAVEPTDNNLAGEIHKTVKSASCSLKFIENPGFLTSMSWLKEFFSSTDHYSMAGFYNARRRETGILMKKGKPMGGKYSFDPENRRKLPTDLTPPPLPRIELNKYVKDAVTDIQKDFPDNPGTTDDFIYPTTRRSALRWLDSFLKKRLKHFGPYEDAISQQHAFLFHSVLTPALNIGLLTPQEVLDKTLSCAGDKDIPLNSLEGFVRQVLGWREFMRAVYLLEGSGQCKQNFWNNRNPLPSSFYDATTGIEPVDAVLQRVHKYAYAHHIERLMILGNFMLLCEIHPDEVYRWFMEMFIDAYDWVMVPNVYGMSQYADGGLITTKPYISSSNYIRKMSDFAPGSWCEIWDGLFWRFIDKHRDVFQANPRMSVIVRQLNRMDKARLRQHYKKAETYLSK